MKKVPRIMLIAICVSPLAVGVVFGQGETLTGSGYTNPSIVHAAPGQITTLFVSGLTTVLSQSVAATAVPLPTTLAGISVTLNQSGGQATAVPLLSIQQVSACSDAGAAGSSTVAQCLITAITIQVPLELVVSPSNTADLVVSENQIASQAFRVIPVSDNLHVIGTCDTFPSPQVPSVFCAPLVTHADGTLVTAADPAQAGEEVVIWAFGLGQTTPVAKTGQSSPTPAATVPSLLYLQFDFRINSAPSRPYLNPAIVAPIPTPAPSFVGLAPGEVGLYQINVAIPSQIPAVGSCATSTGNPPSSTGGITLYNIVQSNLTIDLGAPMSFDGASICVQSGQ
jgi:uncharacterized protein (TIGR03437 family)